MSVGGREVGVRLLIFYLTSFCELQCISVNQLSAVSKSWIQEMLKMKKSHDYERLIV